MRVGFFAIALCATPAFADDGSVALTGCDVDAEAQQITCYAENLTDTAIAGLSYDLRLMEGDRAVPWGVSRGEIQIPGGIEPGERKPLRFETQGLPVDGWSENLRPIGDVTVLPWQSDEYPSGAIDTSARPVLRPSRPTIEPGAPMTAAERSAVNAAFESARRAVNRCGRDGFNLPEDKYEQWRVVEMTFDTESMRIR